MTADHMLAAVLVGGLLLFLAIAFDPPRRKP